MFKPIQEFKAELVAVEGVAKKKIKRGDDKARLKALEASFLKLTSQARLENRVRKICTMECICKDSGVDKNYVHGYKSRDPKIKAQYKAFQKKVNDFIHAFVENKNDEPSLIGNYIIERKNALIKYQKMKLELKTVRSQRTRYQEEYAKALNKITMLEAMQKSSQGETNVASLYGNISTNVLSPDELLMYNGEYSFYDEDKRYIAWKTAYDKFESYMKRDVPQTVYLLHGLPSSGKSEWFKNEKHLTLCNERHRVFVDACNLTYQERYEWYMRVARAKNCKVCIVRFLVDYKDITMRNALRKEGKQLELYILDDKKNIMEKQPIDPVKEYMIDEIIYVKN